MSDRVHRLALAVVALAGVAVAAYLTYVHYRPGSLICTGGGGCETVQESQHAELLGVPVALLGLASYLVVLACVVWDTPLARTLAATVGVAGLAFAAYLVVLQASVIEAWCVWCLVNDVAIVPLLAVLAVVRAARGQVMGT